MALKCRCSTNPNDSDLDLNLATTRQPLRQADIGRCSVFAAVLAIVFVATPAYAVDLIECYMAARSHDSIIASAQAAHTGGIEVLQQAQAQLGTTVQATGSAGLLQTHLLGYPPSNGATTQAALTLTKPLYHRGDSIVVDQAQSQISKLDAQLSGASQDLVLRVAQAYFNTLLAQDLLEATLREEESIATQLAHAKRSYEVGTVTITDVSDAQARYDVVVSTEAQNRGDLELARRALEQLTGIHPEALAAVDVHASLHAPEPQDLSYWITTAQSSNPAVVQAAAALDAQQREIDHAKSTGYPNLDLVASVSKQDYSQADLNVLGTGGKTMELGVQVSWTLWDSGMRNSRVRQANSGAEQARDDLQTSRNLAAQAARQAYIGVNSALTQVQALERAAKSGRISLDASLRGNEVGTRTAVDILNARQLLFQTLRQLAAARYTAILDLLQLKSTVGNLSAADLEGLTSAKAEPGLFPSESPIPH